MKKTISLKAVRKMWKVGPIRARAHLMAHGILPKHHAHFPSIPLEEVLKIDPPPIRGKTDKDAYVPTQAEIRQGCLEVQSMWSEEERAKRYVGPVLGMELLAYGWDGYGFQEKLA